MDVVTHSTKSGLDVSLGVNTQVFGRTFQDRSHVFNIVPAASLDGASTNARVHNVNVMGRRGNFVQTRPAFQYAFSPPFLDASFGDFIQCVVFPCRVPLCCAHHHPPPSPPKYQFPLDWLLEQ